MMDPYSQKTARWKDLIEHLVINPERITITALADKMGVSRQTIYNDFNDPEFIALKNEVVNALTHKGGLVKAFAINNIIRDIVENKNVATSKWWLENIERIKDQDLEPQIPQDPLDRFKKDSDENIEELDPEMAPEVFELFRDLRSRLRSQGIEVDSSLDETPAKGD